MGGGPQRGYRQEAAGVCLLLQRDLQKPLASPCRPRVGYCLWKAASGEQVCPQGSCEQLSCRCSPTSLQQCAAAGWTAHTPLSTAFPLGSKEMEKSNVGISQCSQVLSLSAAGLLVLSQLASNYPAASKQGCWGILVNQHPKRNSASKA